MSSRATAYGGAGILWLKEKILFDESTEQETMHRVLVIQSYGDQLGGSTTFLRNLVHSINHERFRVVVRFLSDGYLVDEFRRENVDVGFIRSGSLHSIRRFLLAISRLALLMRRDGTELMFCNDTRAHIYGGLAALVAGVPECFYFHGLFDRKNIVTRMALAIPSQSVMLNSNTNRRRLLLDYPQFSGESRVVYPGVDVPGTSRLERNGIRREFGISEATPLVTMPGLLMEWKGQEYFIRAVPLILKEFPETKFLIVGDAQSSSHIPYKERLENLVKELYLENSVVFVGHRNDIYDIIGASDMVVHASTSPEPFGMVITEAMACEKPVIATNIGGPGEIIEDGVDGILIPPRNAKAIAEACVRLLREPSLCARMGKTGGEKAAKYFTALRMTQQIEELWMNLTRFRKR